MPWSQRHRSNASSLPLFFKDVLMHALTRQSALHLMCCLSVLALLVGCSANPGAGQSDMVSPSDDPNDTSGNAMTTATIHTDKGEIKIELFVDDCPETTAKFIKLAKDGFNDGLTFHRVIPDFMVQGGCPEGTGTGGPGYKFADEKSALQKKHQVGSLSMANAGPNTNGSQFFITHIKTDWLDGKHAVFGQVLEGQDVVDTIEGGDTMNQVVIEEG